MKIDLSEPVHVAGVAMIVLMVAAILCVSLMGDIDLADRDAISGMVVGLMLAACAVVGTRSDVERKDKMEEKRCEE